MGMTDTLKKLMDSMGITNPNPSEMRNLLMQHARNDVLCHTVRRMGLHTGLSDLDCMTILAFNAIIARDSVQDAYFSHINLCVSPHMILPTPPAPGTEGE